MLVFQGMDFRCQRFRSVSRHDFTFSLKDDCPLVVMIIHVMNRNTTFLFPGSDHRLVYFHAVHTLAPVRGQQGRMDINYPVWISVDDSIRHLPEKTRQHDQINIQSFQFIQNQVRMRELFPSENKRRHA